MGDFLDHPIFKWIAGAVTALSLAAGAGGVWWYLQEDKLLNERWYKDDQKWNAEQLARMSDILLRQEAISKEMATQTLRLDDINKLINTHWEQREQRFEELETEHKLLMKSISDVRAEVAYRLGIHVGKHAP